MMDDLVKRLNASIGGIQVPEIMHGDNLAILLCTAFEDMDGEIDDNGWTEAATTGCEAVLQSIRNHYAPIAARIKELEHVLQTERRTADWTEDRAKKLKTERDALARENERLLANIESVICEACGLADGKDEAQFIERRLRAAVKGEPTPPAPPA